MTADSDRELTVSPTGGELLPAGSEGSLITVTLLPSKYGKDSQGKLVVQVCLYIDTRWCWAEIKQGRLSVSSHAMLKSHHI